LPLSRSRNPRQRCRVSAGYISKSAIRGGGLRFFAVTRGTDVLRKTTKMPVSHSVGYQVAQQQQHRVERSRMEIVMNYSYWRPERLVFTDAAERRAPRTTVAWDRVVSVLTSADLLALTIFCMIGLLVSLAVILTFPAFGETIEALQQYY
jgi:hypothetical protein